MNYNIWNKWDPLEVCMLGNNYAPEFFNGIPDKAGDPLKRICEETLEDLEGYKNTLKQFDVKVIQPDMDTKERFLDNPHEYPRGPLQPRDHQLVIGNVCFTNKEKDHPNIHKKLLEYDKNNTICADKLLLPPHKYNEIACTVSGDWPIYEDYANGCELKTHVSKEISELNFEPFCITSANSFMFDNRLVIGCDDFGGITDNSDGILYYLKKYTNIDFELEMAPMDGHIDGNYHPLKQGAIISLNDVQTYEDTFPGWEICFLPEEGFEKLTPFIDLKQKNQGKWWLAGEEDNDEFTNFVETWLQDWVGYVEETVFDVNVLMLDQNHCCVSNPNNETVNKFFKKHKIKPVHVPFRHRYFWDGGLHCITLDLKRR